MFHIRLELAGLHGNRCRSEGEEMIYLRRHGRKKKENISFSH